MTNFFVDTSALAKRYIAEIGSTWVKSWTRPRAGHQIIISRLTTIEIVSLLMRRQRQKSISALQVKRARQSFLLHLRTHYMIVEIDNTVLAWTKRLLVRHPLRTLDAIQLASAISVARTIPFTFVSADINLLTAAVAEGLLTDDPNAHP